MSLLDRVFISVANRRRLGADITRAIIDMNLTWSIFLEDAEPTTLAITVDDPDGHLINSDVLVRASRRPLGEPEGRALRPIDLEFDGDPWRLWTATRENTSVRLDFIPRQVAYLMQH